MLTIFLDKMHTTKSVSRYLEEKTEKIVADSNAEFANTGKRVLYIAGQQF